MRLTALLLIIAAAAWRMATVGSPELGNFSPVMALAFCGGVYFRDRRFWLAPFVALVASDLYIDHYYAVEYHYGMGLAGAAARVLCFAAGLGIGRWVAYRRTAWNLLAGTLAASLLFYFATNTVSWAEDPGYSHGLAGWFQAMTVGHPEFAPTLFFFRNTMASDLIFTGCFAFAMEAILRKKNSPAAGA